ncbi:MAG TPA: twin-arginine translocase subunit TatC, partial [Terriglobales bacterium]|nr:twin-arginine translocase subunit TatC [Terriglobales bacterium]
MPDLETIATAAREKVTEKMSAMSFLEHLEELRKRIIYSLIAVAAGFGICWNYAEKIYGYMQAPIMKALAHNHMDQKLVYLNPTEP